MKVVVSTGTGTDGRWDGRPAVGGRAVHGPHVVHGVGQRGLRRPVRRRGPIPLAGGPAAVACRVRAAHPPVGMLLLVGLFGLLAVAVPVLLPGLADHRADVPAATTVVRVGQGEGLWQLASRVAPASDPSAVVRRIQELNGLADSSVHPGQPLEVPDGLSPAPSRISAGLRP